MSLDITTLALSVSSTGIKEAATALEALSVAASKVEAKAKTVKEATSGLSASQQKQSENIEKLIAKFEKQATLMGANTSQQNAYAVAMRNGSAAQVVMAQSLGAEVDAYRAKGAAQAKAIADNKQLEASYKKLEKEANAYAAALAKEQSRTTAKENKANELAMRAYETKKLSDAQRELTRHTNELAAAEARLNKDHGRAIIEDKIRAYKQLGAAQSEALRMNSALNAAQRRLDTDHGKAIIEDKARAYQKLSAAQSEAIRMNNAMDASLKRLSATTRSHNVLMAEAHGLARGLSGAFGALWMTYGNIAGMTIGVALGASLKNIITIGKEVEKQLNFVFALSEDRKAVNLDDFLRITESSVQSVTDAASAMRALAQNGLTVSESLSALPSILDLATVGEMNVGQAAIAATGAVGAFGLSMSDVGRVADIFAKTAATSNTSVLAMTESMKQASTASALFKVSIEETAALLGLLAKINITGGAAGTSLTNMLTGLYEPTEQAKKAMIRLGVSAFDSNGKMKNVVLLLEDIKRASSDLSDKTKADIFGAMVTARGMKTLIQSTENLNALKNKVVENTEALGFMKGVVEKLEDDSAHAFIRMGVIIQNEFTRAFAAAAPEVQKLGILLGDIFKGDSTKTHVNELTGAIERDVTAIGHLVTNLVKLANFLVEHAGAVTTVIVAYAAWRLAIGYTVVQQTALGASTVTLGALFGTWRTAVAAATVAQGASTAASLLHTSAHAAGASTMAVFTAATEANTAATVANGVAQKAAMAFLLPALGAVAVAIGIAAALWLVFRDNSSDAATANVKMGNTIHTIGEQLDKEIERLERSNELWDERNKKFGDASSVTPKALEGAEKIVSQINASMEKLTGKKAEVMGLYSSVLGTVGSKNNWADVNIFIPGVKDLAKEYLVARDNLKTLQDQSSKSIGVIANKGVESARKDLERLQSKIGEFVQGAKDVGAGGKTDYLETDPKRRAIRLEAESLLSTIKQINASPVGEAELKKTAAQISVVNVEYKRLQDKLSKATRTEAEPPKKVEVNDAFQKQINEQQVVINAAKKQAEVEKALAQSAYKQGLLGERGLIEMNYAVETAMHGKTIEALNAKVDAESNAANKRAMMAKHMGEITAAEDAIEAASGKRASAIAELEVTNQEKIQKALAAGYTAKGQFAKAYESEFKAKHEVEMARLQQNIDMEVDIVKKGAFEKYKASLEAQFGAGMGHAQSKEAMAAFVDEAERVRNSLKGIQTASEGLGLAAMLQAATAASKELADSMPKMESLKGGITDPTQLNEANAQLINLAENQRKLWAGVGESISRSLGDAFGYAGKAAGELLMVSINTGNVETKLAADKAAAIRSTEAAHKEFGFSQFDTAKALNKINIDYASKEKSVRIKAYGDMAGAAKGFFKEGSTGYKVMATAEKAFRVMELVEAARVFAVKSGFLMGLLGLKVATDTQAAASDGAYTLASIARAGLRAAADGIAAIAKAIASLPFPMNIIAGAATAAALIGFGVKVFGGGGGGSAPTSEDRQKTQGTGSVLGDKDAKSESIANSLSIMERNSGLGLAQGGSMVTYLRSMATGLRSLAARVVQTSGITGDTAKDQWGSMAKFEEKFWDAIGIGGKLKEWSLKLNNAIFGGKTTVMDTGFTLGKATLGKSLDNGVKANQYTDIKKDGGWFHSDKTKQSLSTLGPEADSQFTKIIGGMYGALQEAGDMFGIGGDEFTNRLKSFVVDVGNVSLKGLKGDEIQKELEAVFSKLGDDMAKFAIGGLDKFQEAGEGYLETVARLANDLIQVKDVFAVLGKTFNLTGIAAITVSENLIEAAGGLDKLTEGTKYFVDNFLTEAERMGPITNSVNNRLAELNVTGVTSIESFSKLVRSLDLTDPASQKLYGSLLELAPAFKESADYVDKLADGTVSLTKAQQKALDAVTKAKGNLQDAYNAERDSLQGVIDKTKAFIGTLKSYQDGLKLGADSPLTNMQKYAEARKQFDATAADAAGGNQAAKDKFTGAASALLAASKTINASGDGYTSDFNMVQDMIDTLMGSATSQVDVATASLNALNAQVLGLIDVNKSVLSVTQAITELQKAITLGGVAGLTNKQMDTTYTPTPAQVAAATPVGTQANQTAPAINLITKGLEIIGNKIDGLRTEQAAQTGAQIQATHDAANANAEDTVEGLEGLSGMIGRVVRKVALV